MKKRKKEIVFVIPTGTIVTLDPNPVEATMRGAYKRIKFTDAQGVFRNDIYIHTNSKYAAKVSNTSNQLEIVWTKDKLDEDRTHVGARVYETPDKSAPVIAIKAWDEEVAIDDTYTDKKDWKKLADGSGFVTADSLRYTTTYDEKKYPYDSVHALFHAVKAGETIGYTGKFGHKTAPEDDLSHFEIFTDDEEELFCFLNNEAVKLEGDKKIKDGEDTVRYEIQEGATLTTNPTKSVTIEAKTPVDIVQRKGNFVKIKISELTKVLVNGQDITVYSKVNGKYPSRKPHENWKGKKLGIYKINKDSFETVNQKFRGLLTRNTILYRRKMMAGNYRKISFFPEHYGKEFWVKMDQIEVISDTETLVIDKNTISSIVALKNQIKTTINTVYLTKPEPELEESITINNTKILTDKKFEEQPGDNNEIWYKISLSEEVPNETTGIPDNIEKKGWIKKSNPKLRALNPFDWTAYGFSDLDGGDEYIYSVEDYNQQKKSSDFIQALWAKLDTGEGEECGDGKITKQEIDNAYYNVELVNQLSKYVCKHKSEWSYTPREIEREVEEFLDIMLEEENKKDLSDEAKKLLEDQKKFTLEKLSEKAKNLMWWNEAKGVEYIPPKPKEMSSQEQMARPDLRRDLGIAPKKKVAVIETPKAKSAVPLGDKVPANTEGKTLPVAVPSEQSPVTLRKENHEVSETIPQKVNDTSSVTTDMNLDIDDDIENEAPSTPQRKFPSTDTVWHFHPLAFIKHMRVMYGAQTGECYCNRDFTVEEVQRIVKRLRKSEGLSGDAIFNHENCKIPVEDRTFERFTEELNKTTKKYKIHQCIQKIHFLTQLYHESARFTTGLEFASGEYYNPDGGHSEAKNNGNTQAGDGPKYKGRGFMQLTWRNTQIKYLKHAAKFDGDLKGKTDAEIELRSNNYETYISNNLHYAMDSAGWFWSNHKKIEFSKKKNKDKYADVLGKSLNHTALKEDKYIDLISTFVNGGGNGKSERRKYYSILKSIFKYNFECVNNENRTEIDNTDTAPWVKYVYQEFSEYQGLTETESPLKEKISVYHNSGSSRGKDHEIAWCAAFVSWCFTQAGYKNVNSGSNSFAYDWAPEGNSLAKKKRESMKHTDKNLTGWAEGEQCTPFVGAVIVLNYSHCAIIVGKNSDLNKYVYIGGNQGNGSVSGAQKIKYGTVTIGKEYAIMKPLSYTPKSYELPELNKNEDGSYESTR